MAPAKAHTPATISRFPCRPSQVLWVMESNLQDTQAMNVNIEIPAESDHSYGHPRGESIEVAEHGKYLTAHMGSWPRAKQELGNHA